MSNSLDPDQDRHDVGPDWIQTVCKGYQQMTQVDDSKERIRSGSRLFGIPINIM